MSTPDAGPNVARTDAGHTDAGHTAAGATTPKPAGSGAGTFDNFHAYIVVILMAVIWLPIVVKFVKRKLTKVENPLKRARALLKLQNAVCEKN